MNRSLLNPLRKGAALLTACITLAVFLPMHPPNPQPAQAAPAVIPGIDVSKYQEDIDWYAVAESGVKFAILRCCKIIRHYNDWEVDSSFETNYQNAKAAGIAVGAYLFTDAATEKEFEEDVDYMLGSLKDKSFEFPVFLDVESPIRQEHLSPDVFMPALTKGLQKIEDAGHTAGVYSSYAFYNECIDREALREEGYAVWEANYFNSVNGLATPDWHDLSDRAQIWQYSGCARCPGIRTTVDRNVCYTYQYFSHVATLNECILPETPLVQGEKFKISGTVKSASVIRTLTGSIYAAGDAENPLQTVTVYPHAREYRMAGFFAKNLDFSKLENGTYTLKLTAVDSAAKETELVNQEFIVGTGETTTFPETQTTETIGTTAPPVLTELVQTYTEEAVPAFEPETFPTAPETTSAVTQPEPKKTKAGIGMRFLYWYYSHNPLRKILAGAVELGEKLELERTPLYRMVSSASRRMETSYLAAGIGVCVSGE